MGPQGWKDGEPYLPASSGATPPKAQVVFPVAPRPEPPAGGHPWQEKHSGLGARAGWHGRLRGTLTHSPLAQPSSGSCFCSLAPVCPERSLALLCGWWAATQASESAKFWSRLLEGPGWGEAGRGRSAGRPTHSVRPGHRRQRAEAAQGPLADTGQSAARPRPRALRLGHGKGGSAGPAAAAQLSLENAKLSGRGQTGKAVHDHIYMKCSE